MEKLVKSLNISNCIHTKKIGQLLDLNPTDPQFKILNDHIEICNVCKNKFNSLQELNIKMQLYIPKPLMDKEFRENFDHEIHNILKNFQLTDKQKKQSEMLKTISNINKFGEVVLKTLFSKNVFYSFILSIGIVIFIKYFAS